MNASSTKSHSSPGQELVEFAITMMVLLTILIGIVDLGRAVYTYSAIYNAAREGARYGIIFPNNSTGIRNRVEEYAVGLDPSELVIGISPVDDDSKTISVSVEYPFDAITPFVPNTITLSTQATMLIER